MKRSALNALFCLPLLLGLTGCLDWDDEEEDTSPQSSTATAYRAELTCGFRGQHIRLLACFSSSLISTELELRNGPAYGLYKAYEIDRLGQETSQGFVIDLKRNFELQVQNASETLILGVRILDVRTGQVLYEKQVGQFGAIIVSN